MVSSGCSGVETWAQKSRGASAKRRQASTGLAWGCEVLQRVRHGKLRHQRQRSGGVRRSGLCFGLLTLGSSATGRGGATGAHRGFLSGRKAVQGSTALSLVVAHGQSLGSGRCWASPGSWIPRIDAEQPCGSAAKVRKGWNSPAAWKLGRRIESPVVGLAQIQPLERQWSELAGLGSFLMSG